MDLSGWNLIRSNDPNHPESSQFLLWKKQTSCVQLPVQSLCRAHSWYHLITFNLHPSCLSYCLDDSICCQLFVQDTQHSSAQPTTCSRVESCYSLLNQGNSEQILDLRHWCHGEGLQAETDELSFFLNPFFDQSVIVRVGGRQENARLSFDTRHPIILPSNHPFGEALHPIKTQPPSSSWSLVDINLILSLYSVGDITLLVDTRQSGQSHTIVQFT